MNELIKITEENERVTVSARELWAFLDKPYDKFTKWFEFFKAYGFIEDQDYIELCTTVHTSNGATHNAQDYQITVEMAKELSMLQRSEKGSVARKYFIQLENDWNSPEKVMARALKIANDTINNLRTEKAWISEKREATAMNTASQKSKEVKKLKIKLDMSLEYASIKAIEKLTGKKLNWRPLRDYCSSNELVMKKIPDVNYGEVNTYPAEAWLMIYGIDLEDLYN